MLNQPLFYVILIALASGVWPLIIRFSDLNAQWVTVTVTIATAVLAATISIASSPQIPGMKSLSMGLVAGAINGLGMIAWRRLLRIQGVELSKVLPLAFVLMPVVSVIGAWLIFGETLTARKVAGIITAAIAIYLLQK